MRPRVGICLPVRYSRCRDGDTIEVTLPYSALVHAIRLVDCWCPEMGEPGGIEAKEFAESVLSNAEDLRAFFVIPQGTTSLSKLFSFGRVVGELWVSETQTLNDMLIESG